MVCYDRTIFEHLESEGAILFLNFKENFPLKLFVTKFVIYGKKEAGTGEHLNTFNQINKHK